MFKKVLLSLASALAVSVSAAASAASLSEAQSAAIAQKGVVSVFGNWYDHVCFVSNSGGIVYDGASVMPGSVFKECAVGYRSWLESVCGLRTDWSVQCLNSVAPTGFFSHVVSGRIILFIRADGSFDYSDDWSFFSDKGLSGVSYMQLNGNDQGQGANWGGPGFYLLKDGTAKLFFWRSTISTVFNASDVVDAACSYWSSFIYGPYGDDIHTCAYLKSDGSVTSSNWTFPGTYKALVPVLGRDFYSANDGLCALTTSDLIECRGGFSWLQSNKPSFPVRNVAVGAYSAYAVRVSDSTLWKWDASGLSQVSAPSVSGGASASGSSYCVDVPVEGSGAYQFQPLDPGAYQSADSYSLGMHRTFRTARLEYDFGAMDPASFYGPDGALRSSFLAALEGRDGNGFALDPGNWGYVVDPSVMVRSLDGSDLRYFRPTGYANGADAYFSALVTDASGTKWRELGNRPDLNKHVMYDGSGSVSAWRIRFPVDFHASFSKLEVGTAHWYVEASTKKVCYTKDEYDMAVSYGTGATGSGSPFGEAVGISTFVGIVDGGTATGTLGDVYDRVFSGSADYRQQPDEWRNRPVTDYATKCEAPNADLGGFAFLSWGLSVPSAVPVVGGTEIKPFVALECPLRVVSSWYATLKSSLFNPTE